jgi:hypothetical protein
MIYRMSIQGTVQIIILFQVGKDAHLEFLFNTIELRHVMLCRKPIFDIFLCAACDMMFLPDALLARCVLGEKVTQLTLST